MGKADKHAKDDHYISLYGKVKPSLFQQISNGEILLNVSQRDKVRNSAR